MSNLDATDTAILSVLGSRARITNAELAERVHISPSACLRRVRRLEDERIIDRYVTVLDREAVGLGASVLVEITLASQNGDVMDEFEAAIEASPGVLSCHLMAGDFDYLVQIACADVADYETIHREHLSHLPHVARLRSSFALRTVLDRTAIDIM